LLQLDADALVGILAMDYGLSRSGSIKEGETTHFSGRQYPGEA